MYVRRHTMAPTSYGQPHLLYSYKCIAPYQHTFKDRKEPALPLQHKQKCRRTPPKLGRVRRHSRIQFVDAKRYAFYTGAARLHLPEAPSGCPTRSEGGFPASARRKCVANRHRIKPEQESLDRSKATGTSRFLRGQLIRMTVRVENLRVIQLSKTSQVAAHRATLSLRHRGQQYRVRVSNAVVAARCRIAELGLVIRGDIGETHR